MERHKIARWALLAFSGLLLASPGMAQPQQPPQVFYAWAPKPVTMTPYKGPNKPLWRLSDILAAHKNEKSWTHTVLDDPDYTVQYIQMAPGEKLPPTLWADDRVFWVVWSGKIRFTIEGQEPFVATPGYLVQVPFRTAYSMEVVGDEPALRIETTRTGRTPLHPFVEGQPAPPPPKPGMIYQKISHRLGPDAYEAPNKPFVDFNKDYVNNPNPPRGTVSWVLDKMNTANIIRGKGVPLPPPTNRGHFHVGYGESWVILEGKIDYLIEGEELIKASPGDFVHVPAGRWHRASNGGDGVGWDTRMAITPRPEGLHSYGPDAGGRQ